MADAKVIPFDDDRSRGAARAARGRSTGSRRRTGEDGRPRPRRYETRPEATLPAVPVTTYPSAWPRPVPAVPVP